MSLSLSPSLGGPFHSSFWDSRQFYTFIPKAQIGHLGTIKWGRLSVQRWIELVPALSGLTRVGPAWLLASLTEPALTGSPPWVRRAGAAVCFAPGLLLFSHEWGQAWGRCGSQLLSWLETMAQIQPWACPAVELESCLCWLGLPWKTLEKGAHIWGRVGAALLVGMASSKMTAFIFALLIPVF